MGCRPVEATPYLNGNSVWRPGTQQCTRSADHSSKKGTESLAVLVMELHSLPESWLLILKRAWAITRAIFILVPGATQGFGLTLPKSPAHHSVPSETIVCPQHQRGGPAEAHWHTAGGSSPHRPSDSRPGKKFKNPRPKARPGAEGDQARRRSSLPRTLPAQGLAVGITALAVLASSPLLYLGTLRNTQHLGGPTWVSEQMSGQIGRNGIQVSMKVTMTGVIYWTWCQALCWLLYI